MPNAFLACLTAERVYTERTGLNGWMCKGSCCHQVASTAIKATFMIAFAIIYWNLLYAAARMKASKSIAFSEYHECQSYRGQLWGTAR